MFRVKWTDYARSDYKEILKYLTEHFGKKTAQNFKKMVNHHIELIAGMPGLFAFIDYIKNVRKCVVVKQVSLFYMELEKENKVIILRLFDNRRDPMMIKEDLEGV